MLDLFEQEPYFTNDNGVSFWIDKEVNKHIRDTKLFGYQAWITKDINNYAERILVCSGKVVYTTQQWEDMCVHIDMLSLAKEF